MFRLLEGRRRRGLDGYLAVERLQIKSPEIRENKMTSRQSRYRVKIDDCTFWEQTEQSLR